MEDQIEQIRSLILRNKKPSYQTTNRKEVRVRCCYCGDSKRDKNHAHMYIKMSPPFAFYCQKCSTAGVLNQQVLRDLGIFNNDLSINIIEANKTVKRSQGVQRVSFKANNPTLSKAETQFSQNALAYFNGRYGFGYDNAHVVERYKAITNAAQFFADNRIPVPFDRYGRQHYDFNNSIGFLSSDGSHVIFRDVTGMQPKRYYNLNLMPDEDFATSNKLYNVKSSLDILADQVNLVISEGVFDIIGVYEHLYKGKVEEKNDHIFAAAAGKGYGAVVSHYVRMGFLNLAVTIYSDSDVDVQFFRELKADSPYLKNIPITIFYNTIEKDFGVPREMISLRKVVV